MGHSIIDRRSGSGTSDNRQRFLKRIKKKIIDSLPDIINEGTFDDLTSKKGYIKVPIKDIDEPEFTYDYTTGKREKVLPGNKQFRKGDKVEKPSGGGGGRKGSKDSEIGEDEFTIVLSKEEFIKYFFEDLELPNLIRKSLQDIDNKKYERAGYSNDGSYNNLNVVKTYKKSLSRRIGVAGSLKKKIKELEFKLLSVSNPQEKEDLIKEIDKLKKQLDTILFFDNVDLAYNHFEPHPKPTTKAVMIMIMDVSGSMGEEHKDIAKRFFLLLYLFLKKNYERVDLVFIRHHTEAKEVTEDEFFNSKETGGTIVLPSLELANSIIKKRYSNTDWNAYCCQCSDGDVWDRSDAMECKQLLLDSLLPKLQYMAYIDIQPDNDTRHSDLLEVYTMIKSDKFSCRIIREISTIWTVFKELFQKKAIKK